MYKYIRFEMRQAIRPLVMYSRIEAFSGGSIRNALFLWKTSLVPLGVLWYSIFTPTSS